MTKKKKRFGSRAAEIRWQRYSEGNSNPESCVQKNNDFYKIK